MKCFIDGNKLCIVRNDFVDLQESEAVFMPIGETETGMLKQLSKNEPELNTQPDPIVRIERSETQSSYEVGAAGQRHKIYYWTVDELRAKLKGLGFPELEAESDDTKKD